MQNPISDTLLDLAQYTGKYRLKRLPAPNILIKSHIYFLVSLKISYKILTGMKKSHTAELFDQQLQHF